MSFNTCPNLTNPSATLRSKTITSSSHQSSFFGDVSNLSDTPITRVKQRITRQCSRCVMWYLIRHETTRGKLRQTECPECQCCLCVLCIVRKPDVFGNRLFIEKMCCTNLNSKCKPSAKPTTLASVAQHHKKPHNLVWEAAFARRVYATSPTQEDYTSDPVNTSSNVLKKPFHQRKSCAEGPCSVTR